MLSSFNGIVNGVQANSDATLVNANPLSAATITTPTLVEPAQQTTKIITSTPQNSSKKEPKVSFFQKFRKNPSTKSKENGKTSTNMFKSKSIHNLFSYKSEGVTFVEPNYDPTESQELLSDTDKQALCFDYSSSWQNLRFIKTSPYKMEG